MSALEELGPSLCAIARAAIEASISGADSLPARVVTSARFPVFVTLRTRSGELRGCVGTLAPREANVLAETARSAVLAATADRRFAPVEASELSELSIEVSVLLSEEPVSSVAELDPRRYGVVVRSDDGRRGLLLPQVPGVVDSSHQVALAREKAGIEPDARVSLYRFAVRKFRESVSPVGMERTTSTV